MATITGLNGVVKFGANEVAEVTKFDVDTQAATISSNSMDNAGWETKKALLKSWSGSIDCLYDATDSDGQFSVDAGESVALELYPEGDSSSMKFYSGTAIVTAKPISTPHDGMVTLSFSFEGTGALTESTVA